MILILYWRALREVFPQTLQALVQMVLLCSVHKNYKKFQMRFRVNFQVEGKD
jgi:hypothetical protein